MPDLLPHRTWLVPAGSAIMSSHILKPHPYYPCAGQCAQERGRGDANGLLLVHPDPFVLLVWSFSGIFNFLLLRLFRSLFFSVPPRLLPTGLASVLSTAWLFEAFSQALFLSLIPPFVRSPGRINRHCFGLIYRSIARPMWAIFVHPVGSAHAGCYRILFVVYHPSPSTPMILYHRSH
jgi:hypothetical protein